jgi:hypothetical protein
MKQPDKAEFKLAMEEEVKWHLDNGNFKLVLLCSTPESVW